VKLCRHTRCHLGPGRCAAHLRERFALAIFHFIQKLKASASGVPMELPFPLLTPALASKRARSRLAPGTKDAPACRFVTPACAARFDRHGWINYPHAGE